MMATGLDLSELATVSNSRSFQYCEPFKKDSIEISYTCCSAHRIDFLVGRAVHLSDVHGSSYFCSLFPQPLVCE